MSDYISREDAINLLWLFADESCASVVSDFENLSAAEVKPVVYCKGCIYWKTAKLNAKGFLICPASGMEITEDDYCSYSERKEANT